MSARASTRFVFGDLHEIAAIPEGYTISNRRNLYERLCDAKEAAVLYLDLFDDKIR